MLKVILLETCSHNILSLQQTTKTVKIIFI